jgi:hypothetical protein
MMIKYKHKRSSTILRRSVNANKKRDIYMMKTAPGMHAWIHEDIYTKNQIKKGGSINNEHTKKNNTQTHGDSHRGGDMLQPDTSGAGG